MRQLRALHLIATLLLVFLPVPAAAQKADLQQHLRDQYQGKTLLLRGFYTGSKLRYDSTGAPTSGATSGDWTTDGVVVLNQIHVSGGRITVKAQRFLVSGQGTFRFLAGKSKKRKKDALLEIAAELPSADSTEQVDAAMSRIFLTTQDNFADLVPDYWKPCVPAGLIGKDANCNFSKEFLSIPGAASSGKGTSPTADTTAVPRDPSNSPVAHVGHGVSPPKVIFQHEPEFSEPARLEKFQGTVTLGLIVNKEGLPTNIHIMSPLGCGLDAKAVQAIETWRFKPAEKDGEPVRVEIAVEVDFHLY
jgi:TonB family protein